MSDGKTFGPYDDPIPVVIFTLRQAHRSFLLKKQGIPAVLKRCDGDEKLESQVRIDEERIMKEHLEDIHLALEHGVHEEGGILMINDGRTTEDMFSKVLTQK